MLIRLIKSFNFILKHFYLPLHLFLQIVDFFLFSIDSMRLLFILSRQFLLFPY